MTQERAAPPLIGGVELLERAVNYTLGNLHHVTSAAMSHPTPCQDWDLRALLDHMNDSLLALCEAIDTGRVDLDGAEDDNDSSDSHGSPDSQGSLDPAVGPAVTLRNRACRLLGAWSDARGHDVISVAGCPLTAGIVTSTGAVEIAVHGWDVAQACGHDRPIPLPLAEEMLDLSPLFVGAEDRPERFAAPVDVAPLAGPGDRLVAFLGRDPH